jgi:hypothetical protein
MRNLAVATTAALLVFCGFCVGPAVAQEGAGEVQPQGGTQPQPKAKPKAKAKAKSAAQTPRPQPADEKLKELSTKIDEAMRSAADYATALKLVQDLQRQVTDLRQENERQRDMLRGYQETRRKVDEYESRLGNMELQLSVIGLHMAGRGDVAGFDDTGFFVGSPNRRFLLRLGALLQAGYLGKIYGDSRVYSDGNLGENESTFLLRRAGLSLSGHLLIREFTYRLELDFGSVDPGPLLEAYAEVLAHRSLKLRVGKQKVPQGRQFLVPSAGLEFIDRTGATRSFAPGWDLGVMLYGDLPLVTGLSYQMGIFNGAGQTAQVNDNIDFLYAARLLYEPLGRLVEEEGDPELSKLKVSFGASFTFNLAPTDIVQRKGVTDPTAAATLTDRDGDGKIDNVGIYTVGLELAARMSGIAWQNEFFYRREDPGKIGGDETLWGSYWGIYTQLGWFPMHSNLQVATRYGYWQPNDYGASRNVLLAREVHEAALVLNLLGWKRRLKWQAEYDHQWRRDVWSTGRALPSDVNVHLVQFQFQAAF